MLDFDDETFDHEDDSDQWMNCPNCQEMIHDESVQCSVCGHFILESERHQESSFGIPKTLMVIVAILMIILLIVAIVFY